MIIPYFKPYGQSSHALAKKVGALWGEKATHTGTLDPAAEGVLVVLTGDDRFKKAELSNFSKVYVAQILFGISTDTHDLIGLPVSFSNSVQASIKDRVEQVLKQFTGTYHQTQPAFSAQRVDGQSAFDLAKQGMNIPLKENEVTVESLKLTAWDTLTLEALQTYHSHSIQKIEGNFRQNDIAVSWNKLYEEARFHKIGTFQLATVTIHCSKRTYIRSLVRDISTSLQLPSVLFSLVRTENGPYAIKECLCLLPSTENETGAPEV